MTKLAEQIRQGADQAWVSLSEGWRELSTRASGALTRFWPVQPPTAVPAAAPHSAVPPLTRWAFLAADVFESPDKVIVRIEAPGMQREDFHVALNDHVLSVSGE